MGKAALELPDTLEPSDGADKVNVDDLLAQMAGEEIDRLLSEADDPQGAPSVPPRVTDAAVTAPAVAAAEVAVEAHPQTAEVHADDHLSKQLDELFSPPVAEAPAKPATPAPVAHVQPSSPVNVPAVASEETATTIDERSALDDPLIGIDELAGDAAEDSAIDGPLPFYLKPLAWLNAPLDSLSDPVRALIGKLALLTLCNAAAVLVYVFVIRRHH